MKPPSRAGDTGKPWRVAPGAVVIRFRLTPKGGRDAIDGLTETAEGPAFKARVRAAPEDGAANAALAALVADWLGLAVRDVTLVAGHKSRVKSISAHADPALLEPVLVSRLRALN